MGDKRNLMASLVLSLLMMFVLAACSNKTTEQEEEETNVIEQEQVDNEQAQDVMDLYLYVDPQDLTELYGRSHRVDERVAGYMKLSPDDDVQLELEGVRFRGNTTRLEPKKSFNIRFERGQDFLFGSDRMNLNAMYTDGAQMRERLAWDMFATLDHPAPRTEYFNLYINDNYEGLYSHIERIDKDLLRANRLNPNGTLVRDKIRGLYGQIDVRSTFGYSLEDELNPEAFVEQHFEYRGEPDWNKLVDFVLAVRETPVGPEFAQMLDERVELNQFIDYLAMHFIIGDLDSYADDNWLYLDHRNPEAKWNIIPWDKDLSFGSHWRPTYGIANDYFTYEYELKVGWENLLFEKILETPELKEQLDARLVELMDTMFTKEYFVKEIETIRNRIEESVTTEPSPDAFVIHDQNHHGELGYFDYHQEVILDYIELRYQFIKAKMKESDEGTFVATRTVEADSKGPIFFTDANGWVIAKFEPEEVVQAGEVKIRVEQDPTVTGVDRIFTIEANETVAEGVLTLYYRNDLGEPGPGPENWYEDDLAIGDQWGLTMAKVDGEATTPLESTVNPYSNKVSATVTLTGALQLVLTK